MSINVLKISGVSISANLCYDVGYTCVTKHGLDLQIWLGFKHVFLVSLLQIPELNVFVFE